MRNLILIGLLIIFSSSAFSKKKDSKLLSVLPDSVIDLLNTDDDKNVPLKKLKNMKDLWDNYPSYDLENYEVKEMIGGRINADWITNTCAIRTSRALNYSKQIINRSTYRTLGKTVNGPGLVVSGADRKWYGLRVAEMAKYLKKMYGKPIKITKSPAVASMLKAKRGVYSDENKIETRKLKAKMRELNSHGIIIFNVAIWSDATGHLDIYDGEDIKGHGRYLEAHEVYLWPAAL